MVNQTGTAGHANAPTKDETAGDHTARDRAGDYPQEHTTTPEDKADLHTIRSEDTPPPQSPDDAPHPNPERRQTMFSRFSQGLGLFGAHVACVVAFLLLVFPFGMNWFGAVILVTLAALPAAFFFNRRKEYLTFIGLQFVAATVVGFAFVVLSSLYVG